MATVAPERGRTNKGVISHVLGAINAVRRQNSGQPIASRDNAALIKVASLLKDGSAWAVASVDYPGPFSRAEVELCNAFLLSKPERVDQACQVVDDLMEASDTGLSYPRAEPVISFLQELSRFARTY